MISLWLYIRRYGIILILNEEGDLKHMDDYAAFGDLELDYLNDREEMTEEVEVLFDLEIDQLVKEGYSTTF